MNSSQRFCLPQTDQKSWRKPVSFVLRKSEFLPENSRITFLHRPLAANGVSFTIAWNLSDDARAEQKPHRRSEAFSVFGFLLLWFGHALTAITQAHVSRLFDWFFLSDRRWWATSYVKIVPVDVAQLDWLECADFDVYDSGNTSPSAAESSAVPFGHE